MYCFQPPSKYSISTLSSSLSCSSNKARERVKPMCMKNQCSREGEGKKVREKKLEREYHSSSNSAPRFFFITFLFFFLFFSYFLFFFHSVFLPLILILFLVCFQEPFLLEFIGSGDPTTDIFHHDTRSKKSVRVLYQFPGATFFITVTVQPRMNKKKFSGRRKKKKSGSEGSESLSERRKNEVRESQRSSLRGVEKERQR